MPLVARLVLVIRCQKQRIIWFVLGVRTEDSKLPAGEAAFGLGVEEDEPGGQVPHKAPRSGDEHWREGQLQLVAGATEGLHDMGQGGDHGGGELQFACGAVPAQAEEVLLEVQEQLVGCLEVLVLPQVPHEADHHVPGDGGAAVAPAGSTVLGGPAVPGSVCCLGCVDVYPQLRAGSREKTGEEEAVTLVCHYEPILVLLVLHKVKIYLRFLGQRRKVIVPAALRLK